LLKEELKAHKVKIPVKMGLIKFDLAKAKTPENPNGLEVVNQNLTRVRIICTDKKSTKGDHLVILLEDIQETFEYVFAIPLGGRVYMPKLGEWFELSLIES
jgi:hypothetical protein